jgi:hypothetical protein
MSDYEYTEVTVEDRAEIARQQVVQFERELFGHELNQARAEGLPADTPGRDAEIQQALEMQAVIISALQTTKTVSSELGAAARAAAGG